MAELPSGKARVLSDRRWKPAGDVFYLRRRAFYSVVRMCSYLGSRAWEGCCTATTPSDSHAWATPLTGYSMFCHSLLTPCSVASESNPALLLCSECSVLVHPVSSSIQNYLVVLFWFLGMHPFFPSAVFFPLQATLLLSQHWKKAPVFINVCGIWYWIVINYASQSRNKVCLPCGNDSLKNSLKKFHLSCINS